MKMKFKEIIEETAALEKIRQKKLPSTLGIAVSRNHGKLSKEQRAYDDQRQKLCRELSEKDEDGNPVMLKNVINGMPVESFKLSDKAMETLSADLQEMLEMEIEVDVMSIDIGILERIDEDPRYDALSPGEISALEFMITEG